MAILFLRAVFHDDGGGGRSQAQLCCFFFEGTHIVSERVLHQIIEHLLRCRRWGCCCLGFLVCLAGLNYWRDPTFGLRRFADMAAVSITVMHPSFESMIGIDDGCNVIEEFLSRLRYHMCVAVGIVGGGINASLAALWCPPLRPLLGDLLAHKKTRAPRSVSRSWASLSPLSLSL